MGLSAPLGDEGSSSTVHLQLPKAGGCPGQEKQHMGCLPSAALTLAVTFVPPRHTRGLEPAALIRTLLHAPCTPLAPACP